MRTLADQRPMHRHGARRQRHEKLGDFLDVPKRKATSAAACPDGNDDVNGPAWWNPAPGGWRRPTAALEEAATTRPPGGLTDREVEVLCLVAAGKTLVRTARPRDEQQPSARLRR